MKIWLIIKREYLTRVRKKSFIITTLLLPLLLIGAFVLIGVLAATSVDTKKIAIVDESGYFDGKINDGKNIKFNFINLTRDSFFSLLESKEYDAILHIPQFDLEKKQEFSLFSNEQLGMSAQSYISNSLNDIIENDRMKAAGISESELKRLQDKTIFIIPKVGKDEKVTSNEVASAIGYACGMILYILMLIYGMSVMRSVMEEKTNRIAEIIVSSVKPFQLMIGKIVGVALVGLTQFLIWVVFLGVIGGVVAGSLGASLMNNPEVLGQITEQSAASGNFTSGIGYMIKSANWISLLLWFLFYFLGGYLLYASLFAAVGSLVNEDAQESNNFTFPITMPIIFGFVIMMMAIKDPNSGIAIFGSLFPLTSPIVMMARIPFGVPTWQLILSALFLIIGFLGSVWFAGKIYRTGILLYGKKITFKEIGKWIVRK